MRTCTICKQSFYKPYNLRRHISQFHPEKPSFNLERISRNNCYNQQEGAGKPLESDEEDEMDDDETGSDGESDSENDSSDVNVDDDDKQDENWVFDRILDKSNDDDTIKQRQKMFREKYAGFLIWLHHLKRNPIHKKIMETVKDLHDGPLEYDREEAIQYAIEQRKFLLDRIVEDRKCRADDGDGNADDDNDDDDDAEDDDDGNDDLVQ